jgi:hypothetical protein
MKKTTLIAAMALTVALANSQTWNAVSSGTYNGNTIKVLKTYGTDLYAGGTFTTIGALPSSDIAKWNGTSWAPLGSGANAEVKCMEVFGGMLYVGGDFTTINGVAAKFLAKYDGTTWSAVGSSTALDGSVNALAVNGGALYVGGGFSNVNATASRGLAKWSGTAWSTIGTGVAGSSVPQVFSLASYNSELYVGGNFTSCNGVSATNLIKWNGTTYSNIGNMSGPAGNSYVYSMVVYNSELIVGGGLYAIDGVSFGRMARWNGTAWSAVGTGGPGYGGVSFVDNSVRVNAMTVFNSKLYVGGIFTKADFQTTPANYVAQWDGTSWSALGGGLIDGSNQAMAFALTDYNSQLYVGGTFASAGGIPAVDIARWSPLSTGIAEAPHTTSARVFPNPAQDVLNVDGKFGLVKIYDYSGKLVLTSKGKAVDVSTLPKGIYILEVDGRIEKFIKN